MKTAIRIKRKIKIRTPPEVLEPCALDPPVAIVRLRGS